MELGAGVVRVQVTGAVNVRSLHPSSGSVHGGTEVTMTGDDLQGSDVMGLRCFFDDNAVTEVTLISSSSLVCASPRRGSTGTVSLQLGKSDGRMGAQMLFEYLYEVTVGELVPSSGPVLGGNVVTVTGKHFKDGQTKCRVVGTEESVGRCTSSTRVLCMMPKAEGAGVVTVEVSSNGADFVQGSTDYWYYVPMRITGIEPSEGLDGEGTIVTLTGSRFRDEAGLVCLFGAEEAGIVKATWVSASRVTCATPHGWAGNTSVGVGTGGGMEAFSDAVFRFEPRVQATMLNPSEGTTEGGSLVTLTGPELGHVKGLSCKFGLRVVPSEKLSASSVVCVTPIQKAGVVFIGLCYGGNRQCVVGGLTYEYVQGGVIEALFPSSGPALGGTEVTVMGQGFRNESRMACLFGAALENSAASFVTTSTVTCVAPRHTAEAVKVEVVYGSARISGSASQVYFMYWKEPRLLSVRPSVGPIKGGYEVELLGHDLAVSRDAKCQFGSLVMPSVLAQASRVVCNVLPARADFGLISVRVLPDGQVAVGNPFDFLYAENPSHITVFPSIGPEFGGTLMSVTGKGLTADVRLGCVIDGEWHAAVSTNVDSIVCQSRRHAAREVKVWVAVEGNNDKGFAETEFTFAEEVEVNGIEPSAGPVGAVTLVTITGKNFYPDAVYCFFGDSRAVKATLHSSSQVTCVAPMATEYQMVSLMISNFESLVDGTLGVAFRYIDLFGVVRLNPSFGPVGGGTAVRVSASGAIRRGEEVRCVFGPHSVLAEVLSSNKVQCLSPPRMQHGNVSFYLLRDGVPSALSSDQFEYESSGVVLAMQPRSGPVQGGTEVTFTGQNLRKRGELYCNFGAETVMARTLDSSRVVCLTPKQLEGRGLVELYDAHGRLSGEGLSFEYKQATILASIVPSHGPSAGGTLVSVRGSGLSTSDDAGCSFGGHRTEGTVANSGLLLCKAPASRPGTSLLEVQFNEQSLKSRGLLFRYDLVAEVEGLSPSIGPTMEAITLTVLGRNFVAGGGLTCVFGGQVRVRAMWKNSQMLEVPSPTGLIPGEYPVYVAMNGIDLTPSYAGYVSRTLPRVYSVVPSRSDVAGGVTVIVTVAEVSPRMAVHCWFGNTSVNAFVVDGRTLSCVAPRSERSQVVDFEVRTGMARFVSDEVKFEYFAGEMLSVESVVPSFGSALGGTRVVMRICCGKVEDDLSCSFGDGTLVDAKIVNGLMVECVTPRARQLGQTTVHLVRRGIQISSQGGVYTYSPAAKLLVLNPSEGTPKNLPSRVKVTGEHFTRAKELACGFGSIVSQARYVTSSLIDCDVSKLTVGNYTVEVTLNGEDYTKGKAVLQALPAMVVGAVVPSSGSKRARYSVLVIGTGMRQSSALKCHFGKEVTTEGTFVSRSEVKCASPSNENLPAKCLCARPII
jgi:hypothetical protein